MAKLVTRTYGDALFELAIEKDVLAKVDLYEEVLVLKKVLADNPEFTGMMNHPKITKEEKKESLENIFKNRFSDELTGFLVLVLQKDRYGEIDGILDYFVKRMKEYRKIGTAYVTTAVSLKDSQKKEIENKLLSTTKYDKIEVIYSEDPELIGGMVIRIGDRVVDSSIKSSLERLTKELNNLQVG